MPNTESNPTLNHKSKLTPGLNWLVLSSFIAIVFVPIFFRSLGPELARWRLAAVHEKLLTGDGKSAAEILDSIDLERLSMDPVSRLSVVEALIELGRYEPALTVCEAVDTEGFVVESKPALMVRYLDLKSDCLNYLGRERESLRVVKERYQLLPQYNVSREYRINHLAYQRGLAGIELGAAQRAAMKLMEGGGKPVFQDQDVKYWELPFEVRSAIACGLLEKDLLDKLGTSNRTQFAVELLSQTIESHRQLLGTRKQDLMDQIYDAINGVIPLEKSIVRKLKAPRQENQIVAHELALMLISRSQVYQAKKLETERVMDVIEVRELGFEPEQVLSELPARVSCIKCVAEGASFADTLGYILLRQKRYETAKSWLDLAVVCGEYSGWLELSDLQNFYSEIYFDPRVTQQRKKKTLAAIYSHRKKLLVAKGLLTKASEDAKRIEELGYSDSSILF